MVGLPARGKTYISKKLTRYLNWIGVPTKGEAAAQAGAVTLGVHSTCHNPHPPRKERPFPLQLLKLSLILKAGSKDLLGNYVRIEDKQVSRMIPSFLTWKVK